MKKKKAMSRRKVGRNDPCPCGCGRKSKRCLGASETRPNPIPPDVMEKAREMLARQEALELQRRNQQGLGKPIITAELNGTRFIAVANRLYYSDKWRTFHDFLNEYIKIVLGKEWGNKELRKPLDERHPVCVWYYHMCRLQQQFAREHEKIHSAPMTGAAAAWLHLGYDLYSLAHNAEVRDKLVNRLKNPDGFRGARYEVYVAAALIRAGFQIEFENEDDGSTTHCEFTATHSESGRKYSVEAKQRNPGDHTGESAGNFRLGRRLHKALRKAANYPRVIFIDINVPDTAAGSDAPAFLRKALTDIRRFEGREVNGQPLPPAYLFVTNRPFEHDLEGTDSRPSLLAEGFQIPDFKGDHLFPSLRAAYEARKAHTDMHQLFASMREHADVPSTFHGEAPEFAFGDTPPRLLIGENYLVPDGEGHEVPGKLVSAIVDTARSLAVGVYSLESGRSIISTNPLSEAELAAYKRHPETFFGVIQPVSRRADTPLELFDFFHETYRHTPRERLLEFLQNAPDIEWLRGQTQQELALIYAERSAYAAIAETGLGKG